MQRRRFGSIQVPVIGQGTWKMEEDDRASAIAALRRGLDLGLTHIDTAELYGRGAVEELVVAEAIRGRRDGVFLVSKVRPDNATYEGTITACERSLQRLKTDHLDSYLLHWPGPHPMEGTVAAFEKLQADGKIRSWGVSNFDVAELEEALAIAGEGRIACNQVLYHLDERGIEHAVIPWCSKHGVLVVGYSPFGSGAFPSPSSRGGRALARIAAAHGATLHQVALQFLVRDSNTATIPKASTVAHVEDNAKAGELTLTPAELQALDEALRSVRAAGPLPML
jgi:diketogulonate reductase-like aldo/keto reductase